MSNRLNQLGVTLVFSMLFAVASATASPITFSAGGADPAAIQATVDVFRTALGALNPNVAGSFGAGRREINWDGVPDALSAPNPLPANFFNVNSPRGVVFSTPGTSLQTSANAGVAPVRFDNINATYSAQFQTFSPQRLFTSVGSNITDINFFVPGSTTASFTSGFGAVFVDVDLSNTTSIQFFDTLGLSLGTFFAPVANNGLSFLGVQFNAGERIGRVHITSGNTPVGPTEAVGLDVVVMDDFIYGEPAAVPEPVTTLLVGAGLLAITLARRPKASSAVIDS
jgi:hypothetical protein